MKALLDTIAKQQNWIIKNVAAVHGGDINEAFAITTDKGKYFLKVNDARRYPQMFAAEADGLAALQKHFPLKVPAVLAVGEAAGQQYLLLEWLETTLHTAKTWEAFGQSLAQLHRTTNESFGWHQDNYLGSIKMENKECSNWPRFYTEYRILPLLKSLQDSGSFSATDIKKAENSCRKIGDRMPAEPPALLHGDLWSGNASAIVENGNVTVAIYDPAVFFGHREMDIALTRLFGGFPSSFYNAYNEAYPLINGWQQRLPLFQLCHLLLHAVLFGGGYVGRCKQIIING